MTSSQRTVFVSGGSSGIGRACAELLGARGCQVAVGYHSGDSEAAEVVETIKRFGGQAVAVGGDLSSEADVKRSLREAREALGPVTGCVVNAGVEIKSDFADTTLEDWRKVTALDLDGAFLLAREFVRHLPDREGTYDGVEDRRAPRGSLVFMTSVHSFIPWAGYASYSAAKAGVEMLMKTMAQELGADGVRANAVAPGATRTPINEDVWSDEKKLQELMKLIPLNRMASANEVAEAVDWLLSEKSSYVTGQTLVVDGGMAVYPGFVGNG